MIATLIGSRIEIVTHVPDEACFINTDAGQFETAIINMAVNARDAMDGIGRLTIAVRRADMLPTPGTHPVSPHGYVAVSVADTGIGIPPEMRSPASSVACAIASPARPAISCRRSFTRSAALLKPLPADW